MLEAAMPLGEAAEDCLKAIYKLQLLGGAVSTSSLARRLGVAEPTVTAMVKRLARLNLLVHVPYHGVQLTAAGERVALETIRHHRLLELYLVEALGLSWDKVDAEADRLEHVLSEELEDRMDAALGHPTTDPHGDPIPSKSGKIDRPILDNLLALAVGERVIVRQVPDHDPALLQYLAHLGLVPGVTVQLLDKAPFGGPLTLEIAGGRHVIGREVASAVMVSREVEPVAVRKEESVPSRAGEVVGARKSAAASRGRGKRQRNEHKLAGGS